MIMQVKMMKMQSNSQSPVPATTHTLRDIDHKLLQCLTSEKPWKLGMGRVLFIICVRKGSLTWPWMS